MRLVCLLLACCIHCLSLTGQSDDPCGATALNVDSVCTMQTGTTVGATSSAGIPAPGCGSYSNKDVWYTITVPASGNLNIETAAGTLNDCAMALYEGICTSLTLLNCNDDSGPGLMPKLNVTGLTPGATVWLRIWRYGGGGTGTFQICAWEPSVVIENADCVSATQICTTTAFNDNNSGDGDINDLTGANKGCLNDGEHQSAWYFFVISTDGTLTFIIDPDVNSDDYDFAVWGPGPTCPPSTTPLRCSFAAGNGNTGLNLTAPDVSEGIGGDRFVKFLNVLAGEIYFICIDNYLATNEGFTFSFGGTATISCDPLLLPMALNDFTGSANGQTNLLKWTTESELNTAWFYVEHSLTGQEFNSVGRVKAAGNSTGKLQYSFTHTDPVFGENYYRLKAVDGNGMITYSETIEVENLLSAGLHLFPNPTNNGEVQITYNSAPGLRTVIQIINREGYVVQQTELLSTENKMHHFIQLPSPGIYFIRVITEERSLTAKVVY